MQGYYDFKGLLLREYKGLSKPLTITGLDEIKENGDSDYTVTKYEYNYLDQVVKLTDGAGQTESSTYDGEGNLLTTREDGDGGAAYTASYDLTGQKTMESKSVPGKTTIEKTFVYDSRGQMTSTTENGAPVTFQNFRQHGSASGYPEYL